MLPRNKNILRTIEAFIGDIRWRLAAIGGVYIIDVRPDGFTVTRNGIEELFPRRIDLNLLKNYEHHGDAL